MIRWLNVIDTPEAWVLERHRGPVLGEFDRWEDAIAVARLICEAEGAEFVVRGRERASGAAGL